MILNAAYLSRTTLAEDEKAAGVAQNNFRQC